MKILIIEVFSDANVGSAAVLENSVNLVKTIFPGAELKILAQHNESIEEVSGIRSYPELFILPVKQPLYKQIAWLLKNLTWMIFSEFSRLLSNISILFPEELYTWDKRKLNAINQIKEADLIISVGAERINDNFYKGILFSLYSFWKIKSYKKFLVLFPQTIGPFHFHVTKYLTKKVLNKCDVIFLRDIKSEEILKEIGVGKPIIHRTADVAVLQQAISPQEAKTLLRTEKVCFDGRTLIGISALQWSYIKARGTSNYHDYKLALAKAADYLIENMNAQVIFIATNLKMHGCESDDVQVSQEIIELIKNKERAVVLTRLYKPSEMKGIMGLLDMCIATRMHACIFSTGIGTPTLSINYQFKLHEYMKMLHLEEHTIDLDQVTYEDLRKVIDLTWEGRKEIRANLSKCIIYWSNHVRSSILLLKEHYANQPNFPKKL